MNIQIRSYQSADSAPATKIWNEVVKDGIAFPQDEELTSNDGNQFFLEQT